MRETDLNPLDSHVMDVILAYLETYAKAAPDASPTPADQPDAGRTAYEDALGVVFVTALAAGRQRLQDAWGLSERAASDRVDAVIQSQREVLDGFDRRPDDASGN